jgi:hypothetical protein
LTNFNEFYGDLWASITFPHQECHNYALFKAKPKGLISRTSPSKGITQHKASVENYNFSHDTWASVMKKKKIMNSWLLYVDG